MALSKASRRIRTREQGAAGQLLKDILALPPGDQRGRLNEAATLAVLGSKRVGNLRAEITRREQVFRRVSWSATLVTNWYTSGETPIFAERLRLPALKGITERQDAAGRRLRRNPEISVSMVPAVHGEWVTEPGKDGVDKPMLVGKRQLYRRLVPTIQRAQEDWYDGMSIEYANFMRDFERGPKRATAVTPVTMLDARDLRNLAAAPQPEKKRRGIKIETRIDELTLARALKMAVPVLRATWLNLGLPRPKEEMVENNRTNRKKSSFDGVRRMYPGSAVSDFYFAQLGVHGAESALAQK